MTTRAVLVADISDWMIRNDLSAPLATILRNVESRIARDVRYRDQETTVTLEVTASAYNWATDHSSGNLNVLKVISLTAPGRELSAPPMQEVSPVTIREVDFAAEVGRPIVYAQEGTSFLFSPSPITTPPTEMILSYFRRYDPLVQDTDTTCLLQDHYDVYLYAALGEASRYIKDFEGAQEYDAIYAQRRDDVRVDQNRARRSNQAARTYRRRAP